MIFSLIWSIGGAMDEIYRPKFSRFINKLVSGVKIDLPTLFIEECNLNFPNNNDIDYF